MKYVDCPECGERFNPLDAQADLLDLPLQNLDFRMKLELFLEAWEKYSFTDLKDKLQ